MSEGVAERFGADIFERLKQGPVTITAVLGSGGARKVKFDLTHEVRMAPLLNRAQRLHPACSCADPEGLTHQ
jgi:hypothetical protein